VAHLGFLHLSTALHWISAITHRWDAHWSPREAPEDHMANIVLKQSLLFLGHEIPLTKLESKITQVGPSLVFLSIDTQLGHFNILHTVTPVAPTLQRVSNVIYGPKGISYRLAAKLSLWVYCEQFARDIVIWNNKTYVNKPIVVKGDGNILVSWLGRCWSNGVGI
jgi:cholesterol 7-dehydrogenase